MIEHEGACETAWTMRWAPVVELLLRAPRQKYATQRCDPNEVNNYGAISILVVLSRNPRSRLWPNRNCCLSGPAPDRRGKGRRRYHLAACQLRHEALGRSRVPPGS